VITERFQLGGKVAIVTGGGRGIGRGIAKAFAEAGADVVCASRTESELEETAGLVRALGRRAVVVRADVTIRADLEAIVSRAKTELGRIDILVNNAGGWPPSSTLRTTETSFEEAFRFNVLSGFVLSQLSIPHMLESGGGVILNISSALSHLVEKPFVVYGTCKAALNHMTRLMAYELAPKIRVNAIASGAVETAPLAAFVSIGNLRQKMESLTPAGRIGTPEDIAGAALYLCSPAGDWVTGKVFEIDGGTIASNWPLDMTTLGI
jgi:7-alpha-hydroxysteroid dehydrogenase